MIVPFQIIEFWENPTIDRGNGNEVRKPMETLNASRLVLSPEEAARELSVSRSKVYELIASGGLPTILVGKRHRIPLGALKAWIRRQRRVASTARGITVGDGRSLGDRCL